MVSTSVHTASIQYIFHFLLFVTQVSGMCSQYNAVQKSEFTVSAESHVTLKMRLTTSRSLID